MAFLHAYSTPGLGAFAHVNADMKTVEWLGLFGADLEGRDLQLVGMPGLEPGKLDLSRQWGAFEPSKWPAAADGRTVVGSASAHVNGDDVLVLVLDIERARIGAPVVDFSPHPPATLHVELTLGRIA